MEVRYDHGVWYKGTFDISSGQCMEGIDFDDDEETFVKFPDADVRLI